MLSARQRDESLKNDIVNFSISSEIESVKPSQLHTR